MAKVIDVEMELGGLHDSIKKAVYYLDKTGPEMVKIGTEYYGQSVIKATPQSKRNKRKSMAMIGRNHSKPDFYRITKKSTDRRLNKTWTETSKEGARKREPILYRGIGKFAWLNALNQIGVMPKTGFKPGEALYKTRQEFLGYGIMRKSGDATFAELKNTAPSIGKYGKIASKIAIKNANNRMSAYVKQEIDKSIRLF